MTAPFGLVFGWYRSARMGATNDLVLVFAVALPRGDRVWRAMMNEMVVCDKWNVIRANYSDDGTRRKRNF